MERIAKPVYWTSKAIKDLERITRFNALLYGFEKAIEFALETRKTTAILESDEFSKIGSIDEDFTHLARVYRKLIHHQCKITL